MLIGFVCSTNNSKSLLDIGLTSKPIQSLVTKAAVGNRWQFCFVQETFQTLTSHYSGNDMMCVIVFCKTRRIISNAVIANWKWKYLYNEPLLIFSNCGLPSYN